jgi:hypothetical protein
VPLSPDETPDVRRHLLERPRAADLLEPEPHGLRRAAAGAETQHDAAGRQFVEGEDGAGRDGDVSRMRHRHARPEPDAARPENAGGEGDPELATDEMRVRDPDRVEAQRLGEPDLPDDLGDWLGGEDAEVELHEGSQSS